MFRCKREKAVYPGAERAGVQGQDEPTQTVAGTGAGAGRKGNRLAERGWGVLFFPASLSITAPLLCR